jgi:hypothetical protein
MMVPIHASVGVATFMLAVAACITGLTQKALHDLGWVEMKLWLDFFWKNWMKWNCSKDTYSTMMEEGIIINSIGIILIGLGIFVPFAVRRTNSPASFKVYVTETIWGPIKVQMVKEVTEITVTEPDVPDAEKY